MLLLRMWHEVCGDVWIAMEEQAETDEEESERLLVRERLPYHSSRFMDCDRGTGGNRRKQIEMVVEMRIHIMVKMTTE